MEEEKNNFKLNYFILIPFFLVIVNLVILDILFGMNFQKKNQQNQVEQESSKFLTQEEKNLDKLSSQKDSCPQSCLLKIQETLSTAITPSKTITPTQSPFLTREFFVAFGGGTNATDDWADVPGLQAYVDSTSYGNFKSVTFEAGVYIPTGNQKAYVRLYNATDQHPVWNSEVSLEGGAPQLLISSPITLDSGNKLYKVQMKTSLKHQTVLTQARLHLKTY